MRILLVEDEATLAIPLTDALQEQGHEVTHIADGAAALAWLSGNLVDIVVSDIRLPHGDGMQILQRARQQQPRRQATRHAAEPRRRAPRALRGGVRTGRAGAVWTG